MKKSLLFQPLLLTLLFFPLIFSCELGPAGTDGLDGIDGLNSKTVPGGTITLSVTNGGSFPPPADASVIVMFDTDPQVCTGDEQYVQIQFDNYRTAGNEIEVTLTWYAPDIEPGTYFVYAWIELTGDATLNDSFPENEDVWVFDPSGAYNFYNGENRIDSSGSLSPPAPNYTVSDQYTPQLHISLAYTTPLA